MNEARILLVGFESDEFLSLVPRDARLAESAVTRPCLDEVIQWHLDAYQNRQLFPVDLQQNWIHSQVDASALTLDRVFIKPASTAELVRYLAWLELYSEKFLDQFRQVDTLVFANTPHFIWDVVFAQIASRRGIRVVSIEPTHLANQVVASVGLNFANPHFLQGAAIGERASESTASGESRRISVSRKRARRQNSISPFRIWREGVMFVLRALAPVQILRALGKEPLNAYYYAIYSRGKMFALGAAAARSHWRNRKWIQRYGIKSLPNEFVYIALHNQPERTTDPEAGFFRFQEVFIHRIRALLDDAGMEHVSIVVKEHPAQNPRLSPDVRQHHFRGAAWYSFLTTIPLTVLAASEFSQIELINRALLTCTVNGSAAWEAVYLGRPALTARRMWHSDCAASPVLEDLEGCGGIRSLIAMDTDSVASSRSAFLGDSAILLPGIQAEKFRDPSAPREDLAERMAGWIARL